MHAAADAARVFLENLILGLPEAWPEANVSVVVRQGATVPRGARVEVVQLGRSSSGLRRVLDELLRVRRVVHDLAPDVIINPNESIPAGIRAPLVVVAQNLFYHCPAIGPLSHGPVSARLRSRLQFAFYRRRMPQAYARANATITVSAHAARELAKLAGLDLRRAHVVYYGADRLPVRPRHHPAGAKAILVVGAVAHYKRLHRAVEALRILTAQGEDYELWLTGGGWPGQCELLERQARELGVRERVTFMGPVEADELADLYSRAHAGLSLSACETFGIPVVEGMWAGLPHVVADEGWSAETVGEAAVRVDAEDPAAVAAGIRSLEDPARWAEMAEAGRHRVAGYTWRANAAGIAAVAAAVVSSRRMS